MLQIDQLSIGLAQSKKSIVRNVSLTVKAQTITALVGGSGSGKTTTGLAILRLLPEALSIQKGEIIFNGENLLKLSPESMRRMRGKSIGMIFQEPLTAFNPVFTIFYQIEEVLQTHTQLPTIKRQERIYELLDLVGITDPKRVAASFPHQLSGGMRQRAMIAQAIAASASLIIADEPTSSLDVTLQARIIELFKNLKTKLNVTILLITHDLGVVRHLADEMAVMHKGEIVESGATKQIMGSPKHEYTCQLMEAL